MLTVSKLQRQSKPRSQVELNPIKLTNFMFRKQLHEQSTICRQNNASLRIRFKSQITNSNQEDNQYNNIVDRFNCFGKSLNNGKESISVDLTSRILKWNHIRYQNDQGALKKSKLKALSSVKKKSLNLEKSQMLVSNNRSFRMKSKDNEISLGLKHKQHGRGEPETQKLIQNYKQTQRVVYFEQLQQRKDKQRQLQYHHHKQDNRNQIHFKNNSNQIQSINIKQAKQSASKKNNGEQYRPWSGQRNKQKYQDDNPQLTNSRIEAKEQQQIVQILE